MPRYDYDVIVIGGGSAGLTASGYASLLGAKTALIASGKLGGDCTWTGCVPSKTLLKAARVAHQIRRGERFGLSNTTPQIDFAALMAHLRSVQEHIYKEADAPPNLERLGVEVVAERARFVDAHTVTAGGRRLTSRKFIIATGSTPAMPEIPGLDQFSTATNESIFSLQNLPRRLVVIGSGPIGLEMAQAFGRLGSEVTVLGKTAHILPRDDQELTALLQQTLEQEGVHFRLGVEVNAGMLRGLEPDLVLIAAGRQAATKDLNLEAAGVRVNDHGIQVDDHCRCSATHIFACGDVTGKWQFTHMAEHTAKVAVNNAVLHWPQKRDGAHVCWCTFTEPELAHVGAGEEDLRERGTEYKVYRLPFDQIDRALTEGEPAGLAKVFGTKGGKVLGASILGSNAGEMIGEWALAARCGVKLSGIANTIHPYPTMGLGNRKLAEQSLLSSRTPRRIRWLQRIFGYRGRFVAYP